jgi:hypothetical protein
VGFVVDKTALGQTFFSKYFGFPVSLSLYGRYMLLFLTLLLLEGQRAKSGSLQSNALSDTGDRWTEGHFHIAFTLQRTVCHVVLVKNQSNSSSQTQL